MSDRNELVSRLLEHCPNAVSTREIAAAAFRLDEAMSTRREPTPHSFDMVYLQFIRSGNNAEAALLQAQVTLGLLILGFRVRPGEHAAVRAMGPKVPDVPAPVFDRLCRILGV